MDLCVRIEETVRTTASGLLFTRFADEQSTYKWHPLKSKALTHLAPLREHPFVVLLKRLATQWWMNSFYSVSVLLESCDRGGYRTPEALSNQIPELLSEGYSDLLWEFQCAPLLAELWETTSDLWSGVARECEQLLGSCRVGEFLQTFYGEADRRLTVVPNPLDPASFGFAPSNAENYFSLVASPAIPRTEAREVTYTEWGPSFAGLVIHEFSHALLMSARRNCPSLIDETRHLADWMSPRGYFATMYTTWDIQFDEVFIRAVEALWCQVTEGDAAARQKLEDEERKYGISLIHPMYGALRDYLAHRNEGKYGGLRDFLPELCQRMVNW